jgi:hypothetical protein
VGMPVVACCASKAHLIDPVITDGGEQVGLLTLLGRVLQAVGLLVGLCLLRRAGFAVDARHQRLLDGRRAADAAQARAEIAANLLELLVQGLLLQLQRSQTGARTRLM